MRVLPGFAQSERSAFQGRERVEAPRIFSKILVTAARIQSAWLARELVAELIIKWASGLNGWEREDGRDSSYETTPLY